MTHPRHAFEQAKLDAFAAIARDIPDPTEFADQLPLDLAQLLVGARFRGHGYTVHTGKSHVLRSLGLMEFGGICLTAFGCKVRRALIEAEA